MCYTRIFSIIDTFSTNPKIPYHAMCIYIIDFVVVVVVIIILKLNK